MGDKINTMFKSRRFWVAVSGVIVIVAQDVIGLSQAQAEPIIAILIAWIVGDSLEKTK